MQTLIRLWENTWIKLCSELSMISEVIKVYYLTTNNSLCDSTVLYFASYYKPTLFSISARLIYFTLLDNNTLISALFCYSILMFAL